MVRIGRRVHTDKKCGGTIQDETILLWEGEMMWRGVGEEWGGMGVSNGMLGGNGQGLRKTGNCVWKGARGENA